MNKRKHEERISSPDSPTLFSTKAEEPRADPCSGANESIESPEMAGKETMDASMKAATISAACRAALVRSPASSRAALAKHTPSIDSDLAKALEVVGGYSGDERDCGIPLCTSIENNDVVTMQLVIAAGADIYVEPWRIGVNEIEASPAASKVPLKPYHFDPLFRWGPHEARSAVVAWARDAFIGQLAAATRPFLDLSDDCAGDVLDFLELAMPHTDLVHIAAKCSSPEAQNWVLAIVVAAAVERAAADLIAAAKLGDSSMVQSCLTKRVDIDNWTVNGSTALIKASKCGHTDTVVLLLEAGADVNVMSEGGDTALMMASVRGHNAIVKLLVEAGADKETKDDLGRTSLMMASSRSQIGVIKLLLEAGADTETRDDDGNTALMNASSCDDPAAVLKLLLEAGAKLEAQNKCGSTALVSAAENGHTAAARLLLNAGANSMAGGGSNGYSALEWAHENDDMDMLGLFWNDF